MLYASEFVQMHGSSISRKGYILDINSFFRCKEIRNELFLTVVKLCYNAIYFHCTF